MAAVDPTGNTLPDAARPALDPAVEEALHLQQVLEARQADDPLRSFVPHAKQKAFIDGVLSGRWGEIWFAAANRSGKSDAGAYVGATLARQGLPDSMVRDIHCGDGITVRDRATAGWVFGLSFPLVNETIQPKYHDNGQLKPGSHPPFIPEREILRWDKDSNSIHLKLGSVIGFKSCEAGPQKAQAAGLDWVHFDEVPPKPIFDEVGIRLEAGRRLFIFGTATLLPPEGTMGGVQWLYGERIRPWQDNPDKVAWAIFGASIYDNPHLDVNEIAKLEAKYSPDSPTGQIRLQGMYLPGISGSRAYPQFNRQLHVAPQPRPIGIRPLVWCLDFNVEPFVTTVGWRDGWIFRALGEVVMEQGNVPDMVDLFHRNWSMHHRGEVWLYGDATGGARTLQAAAQSTWRLITTALAMKQIPYQKKVPEANPLQRDRVNAVNRSFRSETGVSHIGIDPACEELIIDMEEVLLDRQGAIKKSTKAGDPYARRTHPSDGFGYWITYEAPVTSIVEPYRQQGRGGGQLPKAPGYGFTR